MDTEKFEKWWDDFAEPATKSWCKLAWLNGRLEGLNFTPELPTTQQPEEEQQ